MAELLTLLVCNGGPQILNLDEPFADEDDLSNVCNSGYP